MPHVSQPEALVVAGEDPVAVGLDDQLERLAETVVRVLERALRDLEREGCSRVGGGLDRTARLRENVVGLVEAPGRHEVVEETREVAGAQHGRQLQQFEIVHFLAANRARQRQILRCDHRRGAGDRPGQFTDRCGL